MPREYIGPDAPPGLLNDWVVNIVDVETGQQAPPNRLAYDDIVEVNAGSNGIRPRLNIFVQAKSE